MGQSNRQAQATRKSTIQAAGPQTSLTRATFDPAAAALNSTLGSQGYWNLPDGSIRILVDIPAELVGALSEQAQAQDKPLADLLQENVVESLLAFNGQ